MPTMAVDPDARRALIDRISRMDTEAIADELEALGLGLHSAKQASATARLRLELARTAMEEALKEADAALLPDAVCRPLGKAFSEIVLTMQNLGWARRAS